MNGYTAPYDDIIDLSRPVYGKRKPMPVSDRAAQFAPFSALSGYGASVTEEARLTEERTEPDEEMSAKINTYLNILHDRICEHPRISVTYFVPDSRKQGGAYADHTGALRHIDDLSRRLIFTDGTQVRIDDLCDISFL